MSVEVAKHLREIRRMAGIRAPRKRKRVPRQSYPQLVETAYAEAIIEAVVAEMRVSLRPLIAALPQILESAAKSRADSVDVSSFPVVIESKRGSIRSWVDSDGTLGSTVMLWDYGYLNGFRGTDKEDVDVYVGPDPAPDWIYVIRQMTKASGFTEYDEDKVMLGFDSEDSARVAYIAQYDDPRFFGGMVTMSPDDFRKSLAARGGRSIVHLDASEGEYARRLVEASRKKMSNLHSVEQVAKKFAEQVSSNQRRQLAGQVRAAIGVDVLIKDKNLGAKLKHFAAENVSLISSMKNHLHDSVEKIVTRAVTEGRPHKDVAEELEERFGIGENHARLIARDQIGKLYGQVNAARQKELGIKRFIWRTVGDERVRGEHDDLETESEENPFSYDDPPMVDGEKVLPGQPIQCVPGDSRVLLHSPAVKAYRRWHTGQLTELVTDSVESLRCTPNHPVLTSRGWLPAHLVKVGDYLIQAPRQSLDFGVRDPQGGEPVTAEQVFGALSLLGVAHRITALTGGFHGDAADEEIDVIEVDRLLFPDAMAQTSEVIGNHPLPLADESTLSSRDGSSMRVGLSPPSDRLVSCASKNSTLLVGHSAMPQSHRLAQPASAHTGLGQPPVDYLSRTVEQLSDAELAIAVEVSSHDLIRRQVKSVSTQNWQGYVYNFETDTGWFSSHAVIVHNCRCTAEPVFEDVINPPSGEDDE